MLYPQLLKRRMRPTSDWGPANTTDRQRHQRYQGADILRLMCMDQVLFAKIMGSNISNISEADVVEVKKRLEGLTPVQSEAMLQVLASNAGTPNMTPAASLLAIARSNGSFSHIHVGSGGSSTVKGRSHTTSECSEV